MQYIYQPLSFKLENGRLRIINHDFFTYSSEYDIICDTVTICGERLMNVYARLKEDKPWAKKGFVVAKEQFVLTLRSAASADASLEDSQPSTLRVDGCQPLCIRAWDYNEEDLEKADHPYEIKCGQFVNLNIDLNVHGVGGVDT